MTSIVPLGLSMEANPIVIGDELASLGSASNPIVIREADQIGSDGDTEIVTTTGILGDDR